MHRRCLQRESCADAATHCTATSEKSQVFEDVRDERKNESISARHASQRMRGSAQLTPCSRQGSKSAIVSAVSGLSHGLSVHPSCRIPFQGCCRYDGLSLELFAQLDGETKYTQASGMLKASSRGRMNNAQRACTLGVCILTYVRTRMRKHAYILALSVQGR